MTVLDMIIGKGFFSYLHGFGAIDSWLGQNPLHREANNPIHILTNADTTDLAKIFINLRFPGVDLADAAVEDNGRTWYFRCVDSISDNKPSFTLLDFYRDCKANAFYYPSGIHPMLKQVKRNLYNTSPNKKSNEEINPFVVFRDSLNPKIDHSLLLMDAALILAKYFDTDSGAELYINKIAALFSSNLTSCPNQEEQRVFLSELITSQNPGFGFELLKISGFIKKFWPELAILDEADHSKDFHPEGNAWEHTMETFRHRKPGVSGTYDLTLSLGLLLHDSGKPVATSTGNKRYDGHAQLGEVQARRFLERLGFDSSLTEDICFLARNHMLPAALPRLPLFRTEEIMSSQLFPLLMELYRCDESSSFKGLDNYYESSAVYQQFLRNRRNPYRTADGKKLDRGKNNTGKNK